MVKTSAEPGRAIRGLRQARSLTLAEVSERTGLPISTLSKIENGKLSLTYDKLARISKGLEIDIGVLFSRDAAERPPVAGAIGRRSITRAGDGEAIETGIYSHLYPASDLLHKRFVPIIGEIKARSIDEFSEMIRHPGEEYVYVLEGMIELHTDLYAPLRLQTGDSIYFDSGMGHVYVAVSDGPCRVLAICSGDETQLRAALGSTNASKPAHANGPRPPRLLGRKRHAA